MAPPRHEGEPAFWERHLRISVALYALCNVVIWVYEALAADRPNRIWVMTVAFTGLAVAVGVVDRLRHRIIASRHRLGLLYLWSSLSLGFVGLGAVLDGGPRSPLVLLLFIIVAYVALAYPPVAVLLFSAAAVATYAAVAATSAARGADLLVEACIIAIFGILGCMAARNHWQARQEQFELGRRLEHLALVDPLTGCFNRRALWENLAVELARAHRHGAAVSMLIVDIDRFKAINDTFGHPAGDRVLEAIGAALVESVRPGDVVGRIGGDEFAVVLPDTGAAEARRVAERIVAAVRTLTLTVPVPITVSIGLAEHPTEGAGIEALFEAADQSLYTVKGSGRDGVAALVDVA